MEYFEDWNLVSDAEIGRICHFRTDTISESNSAYYPFHQPRSRGFRVQIVGYSLKKMIVLLPNGTSILLRQWGVSYNILILKYLCDDGIRKIDIGFMLMFWFALKAIVDVAYK